MRVAPNVRGPRDVPALRTFLQQGWKHDYHYTIENVGQDEHGEFWSEHTQEAAHWERRALVEPSLWWVTADMTDLLAAAETGLPDETILEPELVPQSNGLVVFAKPLHGIDSKVVGHEVFVDAILWDIANLPPWPGFNEKWELALGMSSYRVWRADEPFDQLMLNLAYVTGALDAANYLAGENGVYDWRELRGDIWIPLGRSDWVYGKPVDHRHMPCEDVTLRSIIEDRKRVATMWLLQAQEGIANTEASHGSRAERRRAERERIPQPTVRVVDINRRGSRRAAAGGDDGERRHLTVRSLTDAYWRKRPYHPSCVDCQRQHRGCGNHRPKLIHAFWRGPEDGPVSQSKKVRIWK